MMTGYVLSAWALVATLLALGGPARVARFVIPVWIGEPIERVLQGGAWSHVGEESSEGLPPGGTHADAAATVVLPGMMARIEAPILRLLPASILGGRTADPGRTVTGAGFTLKTATAAGAGTTTQVSRSRDRVRAAGAAADPRLRSIVGSSSMLSKRSQSPEPLAGQIAVHGEGV